MVLIDTERVVRLSAGRPWELKLVDMIEGREGRISGMKEAVIHRLLTTDVDGDGDVAISSANRNFKGRIDRINPTADPATRQVFRRGASARRETLPTWEDACGQMAAVLARHGARHG